MISRVIIKNTILSLLLLLVLAGCNIKNQPKNVKEVVGIETLKEIDGCYNNRSDPTVDHGYTDHLSRIVKNEITSYSTHERIDTICIKTFQNKIKIKAISSHEIDFTKTYILGVDFNLTSGRIFKSQNEVKKGLGVAFNHSSQEYGMDIDGNVLVRYQSFVTGIAMPIIPIPVVANTVYVYRFQKKKEYKDDTEWNF
jgi:hypothetical protein